MLRSAATSKTDKVQAGQGRTHRCTRTTISPLSSCSLCLSISTLVFVISKFGLAVTVLNSMAGIMITRSAFRTIQASPVREHSQAARATAPLSSFMLAVCSLAGAIQPWWWSRGNRGRHSSTQQLHLARSTQHRQTAQAFRRGNTACDGIATEIRGAIHVQNNLTGTDVA